MAPGAAVRAQAGHAAAVALSGDSSGTFGMATYVPTPAYPADVAIASVTGNGRNDLVIAGGMGHQHYLWMYPQQRDGRLGAPQKITIGGQLTDEYTMVVADLYGNRRHEEMLTAPGKILVYTSDGGRLTGPAPVSIPTFTNNVAVADVNHDGHPDIAAANGGASSVTVYYGSSSHHFSRGPTLRYSHGGVWYTPVHTADFGVPGRTDLAFYDGVTMDVRRQQRDGSYGPVTSYQVAPVHGSAFPGGGSAALGDLTGDGRPDLVLPNQGNRPWSAVEVFPDEPGGRLGAPSVYPTLDIPGPMTIADLAGNGRNDLVVQHEDWEHVGIMLQRADGRLSPEALYPVTDCCDGPFSQPAVGDLNGDGRPDIAVTARQRGVAILFQK